MEKDDKYAGLVIDGPMAGKRAVWYSDVMECRVCPPIDYNERSYDGSMPANASFAYDIVLYRHHVFHGKGFWVSGDFEPRPNSIDDYIMETLVSKFIEASVDTMPTKALK